LIFRLVRSMPRMSGTGSGLWRTPNATDGDHGGPNARDSEGGLHLSAQASQMWPTPRSGKTTDENEESWRARNEAGSVSTPPLTLAVKMWPTPTGQDAEKNAGPSQFNRNSLPLNAEVGGSLNPNWVEWLMGFPVGWTDLDPSGTP
jgi:hypothetical protein